MFKNSRWTLDSRSYVTRQGEDKNLFKVMSLIKWFLGSSGTIPYHFTRVRCLVQIVVLFPNCLTSFFYSICFSLDCLFFLFPCSVSSPLFLLWLVPLQYKRSGALGRIKLHHGLTCLCECKNSNVTNGAHACLSRREV